MATGTDNEIVKRLEKEGKEKGLHPRYSEFYQGLLRIQSEAEQRINIIKPGLQREAIENRVRRGLPLIRFDELTLDWPLLNDIFAKVIAIFADHPDLFGELPNSLRKLQARKALPKRLVRAWFKRTKLPSTVAIDNIDDYLLLEAIIHATLQPFLTGYSKALISLINQKEWRREYCPICGGRPDFSFLDKESGARWLICSRCDTEWIFQRLQCPYCGTQDQDALSYFTDNEEIHRLYVCEQCHKYIKAIDLRNTESKIPMLLERILTIDMDSQAQEKGYKPDYPEILPD